MYEATIERFKGWFSPFVLSNGDTVADFPFTRVATSDTDVVLSLPAFIACMKGGWCNRRTGRWYVNMIAAWPRPDGPEFEEDLSGFIHNMDKVLVHELTHICGDPTPEDDYLEHSKRWDPVISRAVSG